MTKTSRHKGLVLGSFLVPEIDVLFGDRVVAFLLRGPCCQLGVSLMRFYVGTVQLKIACMNLNPDLQGGTGFKLRVQFWTPVQRKHLKKVLFEAIDVLTALHDNLQFIFLLRLNVSNDLAKAMKALDGKKETF